MDDAEWLFKTDSKEKKNIARSAKKKVRHSGCKLPSDFMTRKEKNKMNGEVITINLHKPIEYRVFKTLDKELQQTYLDWLVSTFGVSGKAICKELFKIAYATLNKYMGTKGLKSPFSPNGIYNIPFKQEEWHKFLNGESLEKAVEETKESSEGTFDSATENVSKNKAPTSCERISGDGPFEPTRAQYDKLNLRCLELTTENARLKDRLNAVHGVEAETRTIDEIVLEQPFETQTVNVTLKNIRDWNALRDCLSAFPLPAYNSVTISIHEIKEE